jgi:hypothetical protein
VVIVLVGLCRKGVVMMIIMRIYRANLIDGAASVKSQNRGLTYVRTHTIISHWWANVRWVVGKLNEESYHQLPESYVRVSYSRLL